MNAKKWYQSKTLWTNIAAMGALGVQSAIGQTAMDPALQAGILAVTNAVLRLFTSEPIR